MRSLLFLLLLTASLAAGQSRLPDHVLDLVGRRQVAPPDSTTTRRTPLEGKASATSERSTASLKATLISLDADTYETGAPVVYEIELQNMGKETVLLPWSVDHHSIQELGSVALPVTTATLSLEVWDTTGAERMLGRLESVLLIGSPNVFGSLQSLLAGETALIRVEGAWRASDEIMRTIVTKSGALQVKSLFVLPEQRLVARSANGIRVSVLDRLQR